MAESFSRWESDPLFSAAEVVQDSADRMESVFRTLLHVHKLMEEDPSDSKLQSLLKYHRRDLMTALGTTRWQLEDFEREVNFAELSDQSNSRENAIIKHRQFIIAISEQIAQVERSVQNSSVEDSSRNPQWINSNEQDTEVLASFLSGGGIRDQNSDYGTGNSIMRRFLDSNMDKDEIVELNTDEVGVLQMNGVKNLDYDALKHHMSWEIESHPPNRHDKNEPALLQSSGGRTYDLECGGLGAKCYFYNNRLNGSTWGFLRNFWLGNKSKGSFTKRMKDGEVTDDLTELTERRMPSSTGNISLDEQGSNLQGSVSAMQLYSWLERIQRRFQRCQHLIVYSRFPVKLASAILVTLIILGCFVFHMA